jgi:acetoin utilization deacetylase AcuC-like enzyme
MLILHDPATLAHKTFELLGAKLILALESPERISAILDSVHASESHELKIINLHAESPLDPELLQVLSSTHDAGYLHHLEHAHSSWLKEGLIAQNESILPECFPFPHSSAILKNEAAHPDPPRDIFARAGFYAFDMSTGICADTWNSALASANLAFNGVKCLFPPADRRPSVVTRASTVLALCRPPGHHCDTRRAGGYCYINNAVVAVEAFRRFGYPATLQEGQRSPSNAAAADSLGTPPPTQPRVAILDLDFHHGNGTQEAFYADPAVMYISIHGRDEYPYYTGSRTETGASGAQGSNLNLPLPSGSSVEQYLSELDFALDALIGFRPDFTVLSLGFDTFHLDPMGSFRIGMEDYATIAERVRERLKGLKRGVEGVSADRVSCLILLEGGYVIEKLGPNLLSFLTGWQEA